MQQTPVIQAQKPSATSSSSDLNCDLSDLVADDQSAKPQPFSRLEQLFRRIVLSVFDQLDATIILTDSNGSVQLGTQAESRSSALERSNPDCSATTQHLEINSNNQAIHLQVNHPAFYRKMITQGHLGACESYIQGDWSCDQLTDLVRIFANNLDAADQIESGLARVAGFVFKIGHALKRNTVSGSRKNILAHYDLGNDFFKLFLDPTMAYSSAIFEHPKQDLESAQHNKFDLACQALDLKPSDHLLEIGTGWGGLAIHAAKHYGCRITTTTISDAQYQEAEKRIDQAGLKDQIKLVKQDYRTLEGQCDKVVSIEMIEAVGHSYYEQYFQTIDRCLKPDGSALIQAITIADQRYESARKHVDFIKQYVFPGSCIPSVTRMTQAMTQGSRLRLHALTDYAVHYAKTLALWREKLNQNHEQALSLGYTQSLLRLWDLYLCYCEGGFLERNIGLVHMKIVKPGYREPLS